MAMAESLPPDASTASTGLGIRYVGNWFYAYSGLHDALDVSVTWLSFTSGNGILVGTFQLNTPVNASTPLDVAGLVAVIKMNDIGICNLVVNPQGSPETVQPSFVTQDFIIPPQTKFTVDVTSDAEDIGDSGSALFTGRVYGAA